MFEALVTEHGGAPHRFPPIADEYETLKAKVAEAVENYDMVIVNAGSSAGTEDLRFMYFGNWGRFWYTGWQSSRENR